MTQRSAKSTPLSNGTKIKEEEKLSTAGFKEFSVSHCKQEKLVLIPKSNKPLDNPSSYSPICVLNVIDKLFRSKLVYSTTDRWFLFLAVVFLKTDSHDERKAYIITCVVPQWKTSTRCLELSACPIANPELCWNNEGSANTSRLDLLGLFYLRLPTMALRLNLFKLDMT